jgi:hypothetical protein
VREKESCFPGVDATFGIIQIPSGNVRRRFYLCACSWEATGF